MNNKGFAPLSVLVNDYKQSHTYPLGSKRDIQMRNTPRNVGFHYGVVRVEASVINNIFNCLSPWVATPGPSEDITSREFQNLNLLYIWFWSV